MPKLTDADLIRMEAAVAEWQDTLHWRDEIADNVAALCAEVRRLQRVEAWIANLHDFEHGRTVDDDDPVDLAIHTDRLILIREMAALLKEADA